ncbi:MAG: hypothetical protein ISS57_10705 [Anaerolineales bacterium]|nr:hypothetical protein [Chloroflexota bacterium]MBL7163067.1 hypothetical protein [Anaerolineales bacterium]
MSETYTFHPPRRMGFLFHLIAILLLIAGGVWGLWGATSAQVGPIFLFYLLPALLAVPFVPVLVYRVYTLRNASYTLERDHIRLQWGWRIETIPTDIVLWMRPASDLEIPLQMPRLRWPGSILGTRNLPDSRPVEFMASRGGRLILIGTATKAYAISPSDPNAFLQAYQQLIELGSLNPSQAESVHPSFLFARVWGATPARLLLLTGAALSIVALVWAIIAIPKTSQISLGFTALGRPREPLPAIQLMFLPVFSFFAYLVNGSLGLFFYRSDRNHPWAYLLWSNSVLVGGLFLLALYFTLQTG